MDDQSFEALKVQVAGLTPAQFKELVQAYARGTGADAAREWEKTIYGISEKHLEALKINRACPYCGFFSVSSNGLTDAGIRRYLCQNCGKSFTRFTGTLLEKSRFPWEVWVEMLRMTLNGDSLADTRARLEHDYAYACKGINIKTVFEMRHKLIYAIASIEPKQLSGVVYFDESFLRENQKGQRELVSYLKGVERKARYGRRPSKFGTMGPEFATILTAIDSHGYCVCGVAALGRAPVDAVIDMIEAYCFQPAFLCSDANEVYSSACDLLKIPHYIKPSKYKEIINNADFLVDDSGKSREEVEAHNQNIMKQLYQQRQIDYIEHRKDIGYTEFKALKERYNLNISRVNELHKDLKLLLEKKMTGVSTKYLPAYVRYFAFLHNWRVEYGHTPATSADAEKILEQLVATRVNLTRKEREEITLTIPQPSGRAVQLLKENTEKARKITRNKYLKFDAEEIPSFNKREILLDAPRSHLLEIAKAHGLKGYSRLDQWRLAYHITKFDDVDDIIVGLIMRNRGYEIDEEDLKYIRDRRFARKDETAGRG